MTVAPPAADRPEEEGKAAAEGRKHGQSSCPLDHGADRISEAGWRQCDVIESGYSIRAECRGSRTKPGGISGGIVLALARFQPRHLTSFQC